MDGKTFKTWLESEEQVYFVRWGDIPEGGRSRNWKFKSKKPRFHQGLSVYKVNWNENKKKWVIDDERLSFLGRETLYAMRNPNWDHSGRAARPLYLLTGRFIGIGPDGEPLIKNAHIIQKITEDDVFIPHLDDQK